MKPRPQRLPVRRRLVGIQLIEGGPSGFPPNFAKSPRGSLPKNKRFCAFILGGQIDLWLGGHPLDRHKVEAYSIVKGNYDHHTGSIG
jgi:hypothetical protein